MAAQAAVILLLCGLLWQRRQRLPIAPSPIRRPALAGLGRRDQGHLFRRCTARRRQGDPGEHGTGRRRRPERGRRVHAGCARCPCPAGHAGSSLPGCAPTRACALPSSAPGKGRAQQCSAHACTRCPPCCCSPPARAPAGRQSRDPRRSARKRAPIPATTSCSRSRMIPTRSPHVPAAPDAATAGGPTMRSATARGARCASWRASISCNPWRPGRLACCTCSARCCSCRDGA